MRLCGGFLLVFASTMGFFIYGGVLYSRGYYPALNAELSGCCSSLPVVVTKISRNPSLLATGNSVVDFEYVATRYTDTVVKHCSVALHNTWLDVHTEDHYPVGTTVDIYDCNSSGIKEKCETNESLQYYATVGFSLLLVGGIIGLTICTCVGIDVFKWVPAVDVEPVNIQEV
jgi:hypothetical protein